MTVKETIQYLQSLPKECNDMEMFIGPSDNIHPFRGLCIYIELNKPTLSTINYDVNPDTSIQTIKSEMEKLDTYLNDCKRYEDEGVLYKYHDYLLYSPQWFDIVEIKKYGLGEDISKTPTDCLYESFILSDKSDIDVQSIIDKYIDYILHDEDKQKEINNGCYTYNVIDFSDGTYYDGPWDFKLESLNGKYDRKHNLVKFEFIEHWTPQEKTTPEGHKPYEVIDKVSFHLIVN